MIVESGEACPLPQDPMLAEMASALSDGGQWGWVLDADWRLVYMSDELRLSFGGSVEMVSTLLGEFFFGAALVGLRLTERFGPNSQDSWRAILSGVGGLVLHDLSGSRDELRAVVHPVLQEVVAELSPEDAAVVSWASRGGGIRGNYMVQHTAIRIRDTAGGLRGTVLMAKPGAGMNVLGTMAFEADPQHLERQQQVAGASRRPAAILFGDLEGSSALSRRLSTAGYFMLGRRIVRAADRCVVDAGGLPGRHVGDGVVAFFPVELFESESAAARGCISAARGLRVAMLEVASGSELAAEDVVMRFGLHWGSTLYMGRITTPARSEINALGDEVNEAARIEACATGGRVLASKPLIERLEIDDAEVLGIDPESVSYSQLSQLDTATEKARRDAPAIAVCEL
jgi:class 3 adenylate cyclase